MCTSPITIIKKRVDGSSKSYTVPCGRCHECRAKRQSEFAALAVLEAKFCDSMYFVTLTYNDDSVPISKVVVHHYDGGSEIVCAGFVPDSKMRELCVKRMKDSSGAIMNGSKPLSSVSVSAKGLTPFESETEFDEVFFTPSLRRVDVRLFLKRSRVAWLRKYGEKLDCRYAVFGEYGSSTHRPHYHGLLYNLTDKQAVFLRDRWLKEFGFCDFRAVPSVNKDGSPARVKVANYCSKYMAKYDPYPALELGLVESPRRLCSLGFGLKPLPEKFRSYLKNFYQCKDLDPRNCLLDFVERNASLKIDGSDFSFPRKLVESIHYDKTPHFVPRWGITAFRAFCRKVRPAGVQKANFCTIMCKSWPSIRPKDILRPHLLRRLALAAKRSRDIEAFNAQLRKSSLHELDKSGYLAVCELLGREETALESRRKASEKINLINISKQKYG